MIDALWDTTGPFIGAALFFGCGWLVATVRAKARRRAARRAGLDGSSA